MNTYDHATAAASWSDFNDAEAQQSGFDLIPRGISVPVRMTIKPGGHDDHTQGWTGGYATQSFDTGAVYLACEFVVTDGPFAKRQMWSNVGLLSPKGPTWGQMGRSFIRAVLNSARNVQPQDNSPQAAAARRINSFGYPSKDRSGRLDPIEEPHLGRLIAKCLGQTLSANPNTEHTN